MWPKWKTFSNLPLGGLIYLSNCTWGAINYSGSHHIQLSNYPKLSLANYEVQ